MANMEEYTDKGPVEAIAEFSLATLAGKSVIVTGGASGLGKAYTEAFVKSGAFVTIADLNEVAGLELANKVTTNGQFVKCDVRSWDDQVRVFEAAVQNSPHKSCDIVVANAGIIGKDDLYELQDPHGPPQKPDLRIIDINLIGTVYTSKLAMHYFRRQPLDSDRDRCLIIKASIAAYIDNAGSPQYNISKFGARALMRNLRRTIWAENIRVNVVAPWFVRTPILSEKVQAFLDDQGVGFAAVEDCAKTVLRIATDPEMNGRALAVVPHQMSPAGYMDIDKDDYKDGDIAQTWQDIASATTKVIVE